MDKLDNSQINLMNNRCYYQSNIKEFCYKELSSVIGDLTQNNPFALTELQKNAWIEQTKLLQQNLIQFPNAHIFFEYLIPRMGKRVDNIIICDGLIFVIEFKVGAKKHENSDKLQVLDYCLDLQNFHSGCQEKIIIPILVSTEAGNITVGNQKDDSGLVEIQLANKNNFHEIIEINKNFHKSSPIDPIDWANGTYKPTPNIIQASQALYRGHNVKEISRSEAGAINLSKTSKILSEIIDEAKRKNIKAICLVTGIPGAGKTLAGLNIANERRKIDLDVHSVFLSGNGSLVKVLQEALARDEVEQVKSIGEKISKKDAKRKAVSFIQNIHHFRDDCLSNSDPPVEKVTVFDEAQRAWNAAQTSKFMKTKKGVANFNKSEPEFLISAMDRHKDWTVIICLIGGGQEINTGEAGMKEWVLALKNHFPSWHVYASPQVQNDNFLDGISLNSLGQRVYFENNLHLSTSVRSFRTEKLSDAIKGLLESDFSEARDKIQQIKPKFPIYLTRSLDCAKSWIKNKARGSERYGLLTSSGSSRLKSLGIHVGYNIDPCNWFLNTPTDVRSSNYLEDAGTEFDVQGLELDWSIVVWDGNFTRTKSGWRYRKFRGTRWENINDTAKQHYLLNAYRVLLTRARQGMAIVVPEGDVEDYTRPNHD